MVEISMLGKHIPPDYARFLFHEAELLDRRRLEDWLSSMHAEIDYRIPVRTNRLSQDGDGFSAVAHFMKEDYGTLSLRVRRLKSEFAWSENPPTRTRRLIANIRVGDVKTKSEFPITSNFAVYCFRGDDPAPTVLTGERQDVLCVDGDGLQLRRRMVLLDTTVLGMESLSIFL